MKVIQFKNVSEFYRIKFFEEGKKYWEDFWPLQGISFEIEEGEVVGIVGANGSGKSTILKLISGMLKPDKGKVVVQGRVSGLLELGAGFEFEMTGRENIFLLAALYGLNQEQIKSKFKEIAEFADIGRFINAPVKCYSQGMFVRLAFAIAINMGTNILLIDDTLAVGDAYFQRKCVKKIDELKEQGKTIVIVTHDMNMLSRLCKRAIFLKEGVVVKDDAVDKVISLYTQMSGVKEGIAILEKDNLRLVFNNGRLFLNWKDRLLTPGPGAYTIFLMGNKWHNSFQAGWEVKKEGKDKLLLKGIWSDLALEQIWEIEASGESSFLLKVNLRVNREVNIKESSLYFTCDENYKYWFSEYAKGGFPSDFLENEVDMAQRCIPEGPIGLQSQDSQYPAISLEFSKGLDNFAKIFNSDFYNRARILRIMKVQPGNNCRFLSGEHPWFSAGIILGEGQKARPEDLTHIVEYEKLKFILDNGKGRIYWDGRELTKRLGLYTSLRSGGRWHDSGSCAIWKAELKADNVIEAQGKWLHLPIRQHWQVKLLSDKLIEFIVTMKVDKDIEVDRLQTNIMLSEEYSEWLANNEKMAFAQFNPNIDDDWDVLWSGGGGIEYIGVSADLVNESSLPILKFYLLTPGSNLSARIVNSDIYHRGRVLQYLDANKKMLPSADYLYFNGKIIIG